MKKQVDVLVARLVLAPNAEPSAVACVKCGKKRDPGSFYVNSLSQPRLWLDPVEQCQECRGDRFVSYTTSIRLSAAVTDPTSGSPVRFWFNDRKGHHVGAPVPAHLMPLRNMQPKADMIRCGTRDDAARERQLMGLAPRLPLDIDSGPSNGAGAAPERQLTIMQVARRLGRMEADVRQMVKDGRLPVFARAENGTRYFRPEDADRAAGKVDR